MSEMRIERLKTRMAEAGISPRAASLQVSKNPDMIRDILRGKTALPRSDTLLRLAALLQTTPEWLMGEEEREPARYDASAAPSDLNNQEHAARRIREASQPSPSSRMTMPNDVPVRGTAAGSLAQGAFQISTDPVDYVRRPPALSGARDIYAVFIEGESMVPEHRPGDLRFINPHRPPRIGDSVIVQSRNHENADLQATIGHLVRMTGEHVIIGKLNPLAEVPVKRTYVVAIHKVLTMNDLFGV